MANGMEMLTQAWNNREGPTVLATVDAAKKPNAIYVGEIWLVPEGFLVADNYFNKTRVNIGNGSPGALLFITKDRKSFQVKGGIAYYTNGPLFDSMRASHNPKHPGVAAVLVRIEDVFCGAEKLV